MLKQLIKLFTRAKDKSQEALQQLITLDDSHEFQPLLGEIEHAPVSPLGRITFWIIIALFLITLLWLIFGRIDVVVSSRGMIIPDGEAKIIQPLETGIVSKILVTEGMFVTKGAVIMEIDPATTAPGLKSMQDNLQEMEREIKRLEAMTQDKQYKTDPREVDQLQKQIYDTAREAYLQKRIIKEYEISKVTEQIAATKKERDANNQILQTYRRKAARMKKVLDIIAYDEYEEVLNQIQNYAANESKLNYKLRELNTSKAQAKADLLSMMAEFKSNNLQELSRKKMDTAKFKADTDTLAFKNSKQKLLAPCNGYVDKLFVHTIGGVVQSAQQLALVTPVNTPLMVKATVLNQDIGDIKEGMPVSLKIDAYNFQKYGLLKGKVKTISKNSIADEKLGQIYEVYIVPTKIELIKNGQKKKVSTGMTLTAEIQVGKRRIIEFFIYPLIQHFDEGLSIK